MKNISGDLHISLDRNLIIDLHKDLFNSLDRNLIIDLHKDLFNSLDGDLFNSLETIDRDLYTGLSVNGSLETLLNKML